MNNKKTEKFMNNLVGLMDHVKKLNNEKMKTFGDTLSGIENNIGSDIRDINNLEKNQSTLDKVSTMNKDQITIFIEKYFYLIVKFILILLIFYVLYTRSSFGIGLSLVGIFSNLFNKVKDVSNGTTGLFKQFGQKIGDLEKQQNIKEKIKQKEKSKKNSNVKVVSGIQNTSSSGFCSATPKFGTNPSEKDILTQSLNRV